MSDRITLEDTRVDSVVKMSDGNAGAATALVNICQAEPLVDPESMLPAIFDLDLYGIYGASIYRLWAYRCKGDSRKVLMLLRACQLGFLRRAVLKQWADDTSPEQIIPDEEFQRLDDLVCNKLEQFQRPPQTTEEKVT